MSWFDLKRENSSFGTFLVLFGVQFRGFSVREDLEKMPVEELFRRVTDSFQKCVICSEIILTNSFLLVHTRPSVFHTD